MPARSVPASTSALLVALALLAGAPQAHSAVGDERRSGTILREQTGGEEFAPGPAELVPSPAEPVSFVLNPRTRTISSFAATVRESVRCLPEGEPPLRDPRYADDAVETVRARPLALDRPVPIVARRRQPGYFELGRGRVAGGDESEPGSWAFSAIVTFDPVGNPGRGTRDGFLGQMLLGGAVIGPTESEGGRCRSFPESLQWSATGPARPRLKVATTVVRARARPIYGAPPSYQVTARVTDQRGRPVPRARLTVVLDSLANDNPQRQTSRTDRSGRSSVRVEGDRPVKVIAQATGFLGRSCALRFDRARPASSRLRC